LASGTTVRGALGRSSRSAPTTGIGRNGLGASLSDTLESQQINGFPQVLVRTGQTASERWHVDAGNHLVMRADLDVPSLGYPPGIIPLT
jgi:hypothetical protein